MSPSWHDPPDLLSRYENSDEYAIGLLRIWTLLSFYWGSGAVWPKCTHRTAGKDVVTCGEPMLCKVEFSIGCTSKLHSAGYCGKQSSWKCLRRDHDAYCDECLFKRQLLVVGSPGVHASTDIYDATVTAETSRREGIVYFLSNLASRKPPQIPPNWRTTYRLQPSVLVAIVKLSVSTEPLTR
eukprot:gene2142-3042_t